MNLHFLKLVGNGCLAFILMWSALAMGAGDVSQARDPVKALLVLTRESWGCFGGQRILRDVTSSILAGGNDDVIVEGIVNPEDRDDRMELFLFFSAPSFGDLGGYLLLRLGVGGATAQEPAAFTLHRACLNAPADALSFELTGRSRGMLHASLLYAQDWRLFTGLFTCPAEGLFEPQELGFLPAYEVAADLPIQTTRLDEKWDRISIRLPGVWLREGRKVALCAALVGKMAREFAPSVESPFVWEKDRLSRASLQRMAASMGGAKGAGFNAAVMVQRPAGTEEIRSSADNFDPILRQPIAVVGPAGQAAGGEVWIGVNSD